MRPHRKHIRSIAQIQDLSDRVKSCKKKMDSARKIHGYNSKQYRLHKTEHIRYSHQLIKFVKIKNRLIELAGVIEELTGVNVVGINGGLHRSSCDHEIRTLARSIFTRIAVDHVGAIYRDVHYLTGHSLKTKVGSDIRKSCILDISKNLHSRGLFYEILSEFKKQTKHENTSQGKQPTI